MCRTGKGGVKMYKNKFDSILDFIEKYFILLVILVSIILIAIEICIFGLKAMCFSFCITSIIVLLKYI
jgi:hypothetical protein